MHAKTLRPTLLRILGAAFALLLALGCSLHKAQRAYDEGRYEDAARAYREVLQQDPGNPKAKLGYRRSAVLAAQQHLDKARDLRRQNQRDLEWQEVRQALVLDPNNAVAADWLKNLELEFQRKRAREAEGEDIASMKAKAGERSPLQLNPKMSEGLDLNFSRKTSLREIFQILSKNTGINIIFHSSFQDLQVSIDLRGLSFQRILDTLMLQNDLFYKVLDANSIMLFKNTPQNKDLYENQFLQTFYLSNAEVENVRQVFTALMPTLKVFVDKRLNALTIKAKPNELSIANRIVKQLDKAKPEVMVYLELLEVTESSLEQVGLLPVLGPADTSGVYRLGATIDNTGAPNTNKGGIRISKGDVRFLFPSLALDALKSSGDAKLVASPNIRVLSGETGDINIGEKISTTQSSLGIPQMGSGGTGGQGGLGGVGGISGLGGAYGYGSTQFSYEDVGVKIKVEPRVHFNTEITMKIEATVKTLKAGSAPGRPDLGNREIKTLARLRDGETAVFGGLLKDEEQKSLQGIWGLTDIPVLGKLLGNTHRTRAKTDVILTIRAVLVRTPDLVEDDFEAFDPEMSLSRMKEAKDKTLREEPPPAPEPPASVVKPGAPKDGKPPAETPAPKKAEPPPAPKAPEVPEGAPKPPAAAPPASETKAESGLQGAASSDLVLFLSPLNERLAKGDRLRLSILASGGKGVTEGSLTLQVDSRLKVVGQGPGEFITAEGGSMEPLPGKGGSFVINFKRTGGATDSGAVAWLDVEALQTGNAPVLIQAGRFMVGANPISGRWMNALVTVE
ncbi:MAG: tetratricopeptide repeat protein [Acidobacteria bacterium]|nr:tetratricopeptide repeat protein [Acidobacteriota bacterium]